MEGRPGLTLTFFAAVLVAGGVFCLVALLDSQEIDSTAKLDAKTLLDLVKLFFGVVAGAGALVALVVAYLRQRVDEVGAHREATRLHTERFSQAVEQLGSDSPAVRLGGVHALAGLADDAPDDGLRQTCIDVLCAYLQLPFTLDPGDDPAYQEEHHRYLAFRKVRHTTLRLIGDHYRRPQGTHRSCQGCDLDLDAVTVDGDMDGRGAVFSGGVVGFGDMTFIGGRVHFTTATGPAPSGLSAVGPFGSVRVVLPSDWLPSPPLLRRRREIGAVRATVSLGGRTGRSPGPLHSGVGRGSSGADQVPRYSRSQLIGTSSAKSAGPVLMRPMRAFWVPAGSFSTRRPPLSQNSHPREISTSTACNGNDLRDTVSGKSSEVRCRTRLKAIRQKCQDFATASPGFCSYLRFVSSSALEGSQRRRRPPRRPGGPHA
ncbi:hypothetical protein [Streptomyces niveus]|uniref:Uncharacterized protein n=1 Tax=Streptomyces niveus TaxID=193462 RepID=A0ABZ2A4C7_STRNV|nr:hypothetical protein [Streptomyces niveus]